MGSVPAWNRGRSSSISESSGPSLGTPQGAARALGISGQMCKNPQPLTRAFAREPEHIVSPTVLWVRARTSTKPWSRCPQAHHTERPLIELNSGPPSSCFSLRWKETGEHSTTVRREPANMPKPQHAFLCYRDYDRSRVIFPCEGVFDRFQDKN